MIQFCKDAMKILCELEVPRDKRVRKASVNTNNNDYEHKIAK